MKIYPGKIKNNRSLNKFLDYWDFTGRFLHSKEKPHRLQYTDRYPYPTVPYTPGMEISKEGQILNGCRQERVRREELLRLLGYWREYLYHHPVPRPRAEDCPFCRGLRQPTEDRLTLYDDWNHVYRHLRNGFLEGTLIERALRENGYGDYGARILCGWQEGEVPNRQAIFDSVSLYVRSRAGMLVKEVACTCLKGGKEND